MSPDLAAALAAFLVAAAALIRDELARRRLRDHQEQLQARVSDVAGFVGANRRRSDRDPSTVPEHRGEQTPEVDRRDPHA